MICLTSFDKTPIYISRAHVMAAFSSTIPDEHGQNVPVTLISLGSFSTYVREPLQEVIGLIQPN